MKKSKSLNTAFEGGNHIALVIFFENDSWIDFCIEILKQGIENQHYCLLDTRSLDKDESVQISSKIFECINKNLIHKIFIGKFGTQEDYFTIDGNFEPTRLKLLEQRIQSEISRLKLKGLTSIHTNPFQYVKWIKNPDVFGIEAELWITNVFKQRPRSKIFCIYHIKEHEFSDARFIELLSFHDSVLYINEENQLLSGENAVQGVLANVF